MKCTNVIAGAMLMAVAACGANTAPMPPTSVPPQESTVSAPSEDAPTHDAAAAAWIDRASSTIRLCQGRLDGTQPDGVCDESVSRLVDDANLTGAIPEPLLVDARTISVKVNYLAAEGGAAARVDVQEAIDAFASDLSAFRASPPAPGSGGMLATAAPVSPSAIQGAYTRDDVSDPSSKIYVYVVTDGTVLRYANFLGPRKPGDPPEDVPGLVISCYVGTITNQTAKGLAVDGVDTSRYDRPPGTFAFEQSGNILVTGSDAITDVEGYPLTRVTVPTDRLTYMRDSTNNCPESIGNTPR